MFKAKTRKNIGAINDWKYSILKIIAVIKQG